MYFTDEEFSELQELAPSIRISRCLEFCNGDSQTVAAEADAMEIDPGIHSVQESHCLHNMDSAEDIDNRKRRLNDEEIEPLSSYPSVTPTNQPAVQPTVGKRRNHIRPDKLTRKRSCNPARWKSAMRKMKVNTGMEHPTVDESKSIPAKIIGGSCGPGCRFKCEEKITEANRQEIFTQFWKIADHIRQWDFITRHVIVSETKVEGSTTNKTASRNYFFKIRGNNVSVCKTMFTQTLAISNNFVNSAITKRSETEGILTDERGRNSGAPRTLDPNVKKSVMEHINLFPRVESHYVRKDSQREYLEDGLSIPKMHKLYLEWAEDKYTKLATERQYRDFFNTEFNIGFFKPKKDQCDVCLEYANSSIENRRMIQDKYDLHILNKAKARDLKNTDSTRAKVKENTHISVSCFDLQKVLQTPQGKSSLFYYRRKLAVYNFTIYDVGQQRGYCYVWTENVGKKGSNEIASFVLNYIEMKSSEGVREFVFYSDNCSGQNRNRFVFSMYVLAAAKYNVEITHRFLEKGHTQNEGDSVHACIERRSAGREIYTPAQWYEIIKTAKRNNQYLVIEVNQNMIFDFKSLVGNQNWLTDTNNNKVFWSRVREIRTSGDVANVLQFKTNFEQAYESISTDKKSLTLNLKTYNLRKAYSGELGITKAKLTDLLFLCSKNSIPPTCQSYYNSLISIPNKSKGTKTTSNATSEVIDSEYETD